MPTNSYSADTTKASAPAAFRLQNMRAQEQLDVLPTQAKAVQFADLLLAELDGIAASEAAVPKMAVTGVKLVQTVMFSSHGRNRKVDVLFAVAKTTSLPNARDQNKAKTMPLLLRGEVQVLPMVRGKAVLRVKARKMRTWALGNGPGF